MNSNVDPWILSKGQWTIAVLWLLIHN